APPALRDDAPDRSGGLDGEHARRLALGIDDRHRADSRRAEPPERERRDLHSALVLRGNRGLNLPRRNGRRNGRRERNENQQDEDEGAEGEKNDLAARATGRWRGWRGAGHVGSPCVGVYSAPERAMDILRTGTSGGSME